MASNVNIKFVVSLVVGLVVLVAGVSGLMVYSNLKSAVRNIERAEGHLATAEQLRSQGDESGYYEEIRKASRQYGIAVNKETGDFELMSTWVETLERTRPDTDAEYTKLFGELRSGLTVMSRLQPQNAQAALNRFEFDFDAISRQGRAERAYSDLIDTMTESLEQLPAEDPATLRIRGLRGLAQLERMRVTEVDEEAATLALDDMRAAAAADPDFDEVEYGEVRWHAARAQQFRLQSRDALASEAEAQAEALLSALLERDPQNLEARALGFVRILNDAIRASTGDRTDVAEIANDARADLAETILSLPPERMTRQALGTLVTSNALPVSDPDLLRRVLEHGISGYPESPEHRLFAGRQLIIASQFEAALEMLEPLSDESQMPRPEMSIDGVNYPPARNQATFEMADAALTLAERSADASDERTEMLAMVVGEDGSGGLRARLADRIGVREEARLKLVDGRVALLQGDGRAASALLNDARQDLGDDPNVMYYLAVANGRIGNDGVARQLLERVLSGNAFQNEPTRRYIASLEYVQLLTRTGEYARAATLLSNLEGTYGSQNVILQLSAANEARYSAELRASRIRLTDELEELRDQAAAAPAGSEEQRRLERLVTERRRDLDNVNLNIAQLTTDPIADAIERARVLESAEGADAALTLIRGVQAENPDDARALAMEIQILARAGRQSEALDRSREATAKFPDVEVFTRYVDQLQADDPIAFGDAQIDGDNSMEPAEKALRKSTLRRIAGDIEGAEAFLAEAVRLDETNRAVLEFTFGTALAARDFEEAERLAEIAATKNSDNLEGLTFQGRIALVRGDSEEAVEIFSEAAERLPTDPSVARFLSRSYREIGQIDNALEALRRAHEGRPTDGVIAREYAELLAQNGQISEALRIVGPSGPVAEQVQRDPSLRSLYLTLVAAEGNSGRAIESRQRLFNVNPADGQNSVALLELLVNASRYEEVRSLSNEIRANELAMNAISARTPSGSAEMLLTIVEGEMLVRTRRADEAKALVLEVLAPIQAASENAAPTVSVARFLLNNAGANETWADEAIELLRSARGAQSPALMGVDTLLSDQARSLASFSNQRADQLAAQGDEAGAASARADAERYLSYAAESLNALANMDDDSVADRATVRVRLASIRLEQGDTSGAESILTSVLQGDPTNLDALLLSAQIASDSGDDARARSILDTAVAAHQESFRPFIARAILNAREDRLRQDVLQDLDIVNRIAPQSALGWQLRFQIARDNQEVEQAVSRLRAAIEASPSAASSLTDILVTQLIGIGRVEEAAQAAAAQADSDPDVARWQAIAAGLAGRTERYSAAVTFYQRLMSISDSRGLAEARGRAALGILNAQIRGELNPPAGEVRRLIEVVDNSLAEPDVSAQLTLARAFIETNGRTDGLRRIRAAFDEASASSEQLIPFVRDLDFALGSAEEARQYIEVVLGQQGSSAPLMLRVASVNNKMGSGLLNQQTLAEGEEVLAAALSEGDRTAEYEILKTLSRLSYALEDYQGCADYATRALDIDPGAIDVGNDLAFVLAKHLDRVDDAVPFAERVLADNPASANILDTIGFVFLESGRIDDAIRVLNRAVAAAQSDSERVPANIHLAQAYLAQEDLNAARDHAGRARRALPNSGPLIQNSYTADLETLEAAIQAAG